MAAPKTKGVPRKSIKRKISEFLSVLRPGLVTGASDDDPSGIATYPRPARNMALRLLGPCS
jgi:hypothetical protein